MTKSRIASIALLGSVFVVTTPAAAQDPTPGGSKPNILFVIDTSGSMEYKTEYDDFADRFPECHPGDPLLPNEKSRWIEVLEVLTGDIDDANYSCEAVNRADADFDTEFSMPNGASPPDLYYKNPYHRPISSNCVWSPDRTTVLGNAFDWAPPVEATYPVNLSTVASCIGTPCCTFGQTGGFIDAFGDLVRFGLMTFDPLPGEGTGFAPSTFSPQYAAGVEGAWSYYDEAGSSDPEGDGLRYAVGRPVGCGFDQTLEVGVRNAAAPASEGKMIYFGDPNSTTSEDAQRHERIKKVLLATRPYGATPLNGALADVRHFFWGDEDPDPLDPSRYISPQYDDQVECGCRDQHIILITDGEPNLDMRPDCDDDGSGLGLSAGVCPYDQDPEEIITDLYNQEDDPTQQSCTTPSTGQNRWRIPTHVIGFATRQYDLGDGNGPQDCEDMPTYLANWNDPGGICEAPPNADVQVCCTLHELAAAGSGGESGPHIAPTAAELDAALADIISDLIDQNASATRPINSPGIGRAEDPSHQIAFRILTSYGVQTGTSGLWRGNIERVRWVCEGTGAGVPTEQPKDVDLGDDLSLSLATNVNSRQFYTVYPSTDPSLSDRNIRPAYNTSNPTDGLGTITTTTERAGVSTSFLTAVDAEALNLTSANYAAEAACQLDSPASDEEDCKERVLGWTLGYGDGLGRNRCASVSDQENCSVVGHVMHSNPVIVDRPKAPVEDETYATFAENNAGRMMMMYVSSNDGILHGFAVSPNDPADVNEAIDQRTVNPERFAIIPPFVLSRFKDQYPNVPDKLLDGTAVVQDVVATVPGHSSWYDYKLERSLSDAATQTNTWRTILVQGFGGQQSGYFAVDITDPRRPASSPGAGPKFLWQISETASGVPIFGTGGTPIITTLNVQGNEVAVAVLPGGNSGGGSDTISIDRKDTALLSNGFGNTYYVPSETGGPTGAIPEPGAPRTQIRSYSTASADIAAHSLTIVRLDNGEVLRTFWYAAPTELANVDGNLPSYLDSPVSGVPAAFPAGPGMISDRIFVGDQDGVLWRVDVSDPDPADWTMKLFHDSYAEDGPFDGQPIAIAPMLSVNETGQITVAYATGEQDLSGSNGDIQYIYSLTEAEDGSSFFAKVNWWQKLTTGEHILGPMSLANEVLYFSTLDPSRGDVCSQYPSNIWGVHYLEPEDGQVHLGGSARMPSGSTLEQYIHAPEDATVFGVTVEFVPTCRTAPAEVDVDFLPGTRSTVTDPSSSDLQLVFQTGTAGGSKDGLNFVTGFEAISLPQPRVPSTLLSWAAILD